MAAFVVLAVCYVVLCSVVSLVVVLGAWSETLSNDRPIDWDYVKVMCLFAWVAIAGAGIAGLISSRNVGAL